MEKQLNTRPPIDKAGVYGFFRVQIEDGPTGKIVGDSGWCKNMIPNLGFQHYVVELMMASAGSSRVTHAALGGGTAPAITGTGLQSEHEVRETIVSAVSNSRTCRFTVTFASGISFVTGVSSIQNIGLFATSTKAAGSLFCGQTYANSEIQTNQNVNATYEIQFSTA